MNSFRSRSSVTVSLFVLLLLCLLGSNASVSSSLWGKKINLSGSRCLWELQPGTEIPALKELSVCIRLCLNYGTLWTGFVYKAPGERHIELGLQGNSSDLAVWLFGAEHHVDAKLGLKKWHSVCITWSGQAQRLRVYINGISQKEVSLDPTIRQQLARNGTLTLGESHYVDKNGSVQAQSGQRLLGEIGRFGMWAREWSAEEMETPSCADGDVLFWDARQWKHKCFTALVPDHGSECEWALYKIEMSTFIDSSRSENCSVSLEEVMRNWLESIFPSNISIHDIRVSASSWACYNSTAAYTQQPQESRTLSNSSCVPCFWSEVYVNVNPAADVKEVQANITALLNFSHDRLSLISNPSSIRIQSVEAFPAVTNPPPTVSSSVTHQSEPTPSPTAGRINVSTTGEPLEVNKTTFGFKFFRVNLTVSMTDGPRDPKDVVETWVTEKLEANNTLTVMNFISKESSGRNTGQHSGLTLLQQKQYLCDFHVQEYNEYTVAETSTIIHDALMSKYENSSVAIQTLDVAIKHIEPLNCVEDTTFTIYGNYIWPEAFPQVTQEMGCVQPRSERAYRLCKLDIETDTTSWSPPVMTNCKPVRTLSDIENITVTPDNAADIVDMIEDLVDVQLNSSEELSASELESVVEKLSDVVDISVVDPVVGASIVNIVADILLSNTDVNPVADMVLNLTEKMASNMDFLDESVSITAPLLALSMVNADSDDFSGLTFGVSSISSSLTPETFLNRSCASELLPDTDATISLPSALADYLKHGSSNKTRIQFNFFGTQKLFQDPRLSNTTRSRWTLNSYIISASINDSHVSNLKEGVIVTLKHQTPIQPHDEVQCIFWDFQANGGEGGWSGSGCMTRSVSSNRTSCLCDHLTHFAVLLSVSRVPVSDEDLQILTVISYLGCGISSVFLGVTLLTYLAFGKLRQDYPSKILINLSVALLGLSLLFLLDSWLSSFSNYGLCITTAAAMHYFLLASFTWMGLEAVHMYLSLVKVFNTYVPSYMLKFCAVGWGIPLVIVSLVLAIDKDAYGNLLSGKSTFQLQADEQFCWLQDDTFFYVTAVAFVLLILLCNIFVFVMVLIQIRQMRANKASAKSRSTLQDLRAVASLTVLLGLTWAMGFFSFGPGKVVPIYLFTIFNSFQGFFVFLFHCLMKENVRKQWRIHLCCGRFRPNNYSDWSRTVTAVSTHRKSNLVNSDSLASDSTVTTRIFSHSSTGSGPNQHRA